MKLVDSDGVFSFCWFSFVGNSSESFFVSGVMIMAERRYVAALYDVRLVCRSV